MRHLLLRSCFLATAAILIPACGSAQGGSAPSTLLSSPGLPATAAGWAWVSGSSALDSKGIYGTRGVAAPGNVPGARTQHVSWVDAADNFWLFGGTGFDANGASGFLNDLWKFDGALWTWISGSSTIKATGVYGTKGMAAAANTPGARVGSVAWTDAGSHLWLFGGGGSNGSMNDLWKFDGSQWTWVSGSSSLNPPGVYGTRGTPAAANVPGGRWMAASSSDNAGNLWLFGGSFAVDSAGAQGTLNDLWRFDGAQWTWVSGGTTVNQAAVYGTAGMAAPANVPGARSQGVAWMDAVGRFWLFGGLGYASGTGEGYLNDLWRFSGGEWTWMKGSSGFNSFGTSGTMGTPDDANTPGARNGSFSWSDSAGNLWLFGGFGWTSPPLWSAIGHLNDLWKFDGTRWTWVSGNANDADLAGTYGVQGTPSPSNGPGGRYQGASSLDGSNRLWLFGGYSFNGSTLNDGFLNDLWRFTP